MSWLLRFVSEIRSTHIGASISSYIFQSKNNINHYCSEWTKGNVVENQK